jgi:hypothetical protein
MDRRAIRVVISDLLYVKVYNKYPSLPWASGSVSGEVEKAA